MPDNRESRRGSGKKNTGSETGTAHPQQQPEHTNAPTAPSRRDYSPQQVLAGWRGLLRELRARVEHKHLGPDASTAVDAFFDELEAQTEQRGLALAESFHPAARRFFVGFSELVRDVLPELPDIHQVGQMQQLVAAAWLQELTQALQTGDFSRLMELDFQPRALTAPDLAQPQGLPMLEDGNGAHVPQLVYPLAWYIVKSGPNAGQRRPAIIVKQDEKTAEAELEVFFSLGDRPHEPRAELQRIPYGEEAGTWQPMLDGTWSKIAEHPDEAAEPLPS